MVTAPYEPGVSCWTLIVGPDINIPRHRAVIMSRVCATSCLFSLGIALGGIFPCAFALQGLGGYSSDDELTFA